MLSQKFIGLLLSLRALFYNCNVDHRHITDSLSIKVEKHSYSRMQNRLVESSGLEMASGGYFWTHQDSGGAGNLFKISTLGGVVDTLFLNLPNNDWEDLAKDSQGNLYIGNFGNNYDTRRDLRIYKVNPKTKVVDTIHFRYAAQKSFAFATKERYFDLEAMFWRDGYLHLFSKSRGDQIVKHYKVPDRPGDYALEPVGERYFDGLITAADISPDEKSFALLSYGRIYWFFIQDEENLLNNPFLCIKLIGGQTEALVFLNNHNLLISNEAGKLFYVEMKKAR